MGRRYKGSFLSSTATSTNTAQAQPGIWPLDQQMQAKGQCLWPTPVTPPGQIAYTSAGCYTFVAPAGITSISILVVGKGANGSSGGQYQYCFYCYCCAFFSSHPFYISGNQTGYSGGGGSLGYRNNIAVTPGNSYTVTVSGTDGQYTGINVGGTQVRIGNSSGLFGSTSQCGMNAFYQGGQGGYQQSAENQQWRFGFPPFPSYYPGGPGAGGAAGYAAGGGNGGYQGNNGSQSYGAGGGGGAGGSQCYPGGFGGGVGLLGAGANGAGGTGNGGGGSAGSGGSGILYGGGGRSGSAYGSGLPGGTAAVRIMWPGNTRSYPSTCTGNL